MTKNRSNSAGPRHASPTTPATALADLSAGIAESTKKNYEAVSGRVAHTFRSGSMAGRAAVLTVLAVTTVGAPVNAMLRTGDEPVTAETADRDSVVITSDGSFEVDDPSEGVTALDAESLADARSGTESSRSGRAELVAPDAEFAGSDAADDAEGVAETEAPAEDAEAEDPAVAEDAPAEDAPADAAIEENAAESADEETAPETTSEDAPSEDPDTADVPAEQPATPTEDAAAEEATAPEASDDAVGAPTEEGGIPVADGSAVGNDIPDPNAPVTEERLETIRPVLAADETAVWSAALPILDGVGVIAASSNTDRTEIIAEAQTLLAETEGAVSDDSLRTSVADAVTALEAADDSESVDAAVSHLSELMDTLEADHAETTGTARMNQASAEARSAIARGRAYDPATTLDFGSEGTFHHPVPNGRFTSAYGPRWGGMHNGIDLAAAAGTPIHVAADGVVTYVGYGHSSRGLSGWVVIVSHGNGLETAYNHMYASGVLVETGQAVTAGEQIAEVGNSGRSTGPHLHLSVWQNGSTVNPTSFFSARGISLR